jgi:hypothetical protein
LAPPQALQKSVEGIIESFSFVAKLNLEATSIFTDRILTQLEPEIPPFLLRM